MDNKLLNKKGTNYLSTMIKKIEEGGIKGEKNIYGFIIKSAVEGNGIETYSNFIGSAKGKKILENI